MARSTEARLKPEVGESREAKIAALLATGLGAESIQAALELEYTECMEPSDPRRKKMKNAKPFDKLCRQRLLEAIRSTRRLMRISDDEIDALVNESGGSTEIQSIDATELTNMPRQSCGELAFDEMYGVSRFIWLQDHDEKHPEKGLYRKGEYMPSWLPREIAHRGYVLKSDDLEPPQRGLGKMVGTWDDCYMEKGLPGSFLSISAGSPGVGKSRLHISLTKKMNGMERERARVIDGWRARPVLYYNGEAEPSQFRQWCGHDVDPELFLVHHGEMIKTERVVADALKHRPWVIIIDSFQMLAEVEKGVQGTIRALSRFKLLKNNEAAGKPHIIFISQLNKKGEMSGSRKIPHLVDFVGHCTRYEGRKNQFIVECPEKNRGGETGRGGLFMHTDTGIVCLSTDFRKGPTYKLLQPTSSPAERAATNAAATVVTATPPQPQRTGLAEALATGIIRP
jgi:hypothetical protein